MKTFIYQTIDPAVKSAQERSAVLEVELKDNKEAKQYFSDMEKEKNVRVAWLEKPKASKKPN